MREEMSALAKSKKELANAATQVEKMREIIEELSRENQLLNKMIL